MNQTAIGGQIIERALIDLQMQQFITAERERDCTTGTERHCTQLRFNRALISDAVTDQRDVTAFGRDGSLIDDTAIAVTAKTTAIAR